MMNWVELFGIAASVVVLISLRYQGRTFRLLNALGSQMYVVYGLIIHSWSICILNGCCLVMNVYKLIRGESKSDKSDNSEFHAVENQPDGEVGIWWYTPSKEIWKVSCLLNIAVKSDNYLQISRSNSHLGEWKETVNNHIADSAAASVVQGFGYKAYERGEVIFDVRTQSYIVLHSKALADNIDFKKAVVQAFNIPDGRFEFQVVDHYHTYILGTRQDLDELEYF